MNVWQLINMPDQEIANKFPITRRFFASGFTLKRELFTDDVVGFTSPNQVLTLNLVTGDIA